MDENTEKKEGLFGTLGKVVEDLIFEKSEEEDTPPAPEGGEQKPQEVKTAVKEEATTAVPVPPPQVDKKIYEKLKSALQSGDNAFSRFSEMLDSLSDVIADEATRYAAALKAVGKSYGITLDQILRSMDDSLGALEGEKEKFSASVRQSEEELEKLRSRLQQKEGDLEALRKQAETLAGEKKEIEAAISDKSGKIEAVRRNFLSAVEMVKAETGQRKDVIMKYLQGGKQ
jgi:predicted  nucleic acid-binding Zn-ribbon protein